MGFLMFFSFLSSVLYGVMFYSIGEILSNHLESFITMIVRKPISEEFDETKVKEIIGRIGVCCKVIGVVTVIIGIATLIMGLAMPGYDFKFNF